MKVANIPLIICLLLILPLTIQIHPQRRHTLNSTPSTNPRTDTLYARCPVPRAPFYDSQFSDANSSARVQTGAALGIDGDQLIYNYLSKNQTGVRDEMGKGVGRTVLYVIFMAIGLLLMLILAPIMICCCCKPDKCPPCLSLRNPQSHIYTPCQQKWPAIATIILSLIIIGTMIAILVVNPRLQKGYSETRCSTAMFFDDLLNGNYTRDGKLYFFGLKPLQNDLSELRTGLQGMLNTASNFSDGSQLLDYVLDQLKSLHHEVSDIPKGDGTGSELHLSYVSPLNTPPQSTGPHTTTIQSTFGPVLGTNQSVYSLIGQTSTGLTMAEHTMASLADLTQLISQGIPKLSQYIDTGFNKYASLVVQAQTMDKQTNQKFETYQSMIVSPLSVVIYVVAALAILAAVAIIVAAVMICVKEKLACTRVLYGACGVITVAGIFFFVLSIGMSAGTAGTHYGCSYIQVGLKNKTEFTHRFGPLINNDMMTSLIAQCATREGSGIMINQSTIGGLMTSMHQAVMHLDSINANQVIYLTNVSKLELVSSLGAYHRAEALDIDSVEDIEILEKISNPGEYRCSAPGFASDSWVPSVNQDGIYVSCKVSEDRLVTSETCKLKQFEQKAPQCAGCIDSSSIFSEFETYDQVINSLNKRYPKDDCTAFNQELANVWNNFYRKKHQILGTAEQRAHTLSTRIDNLNTLLHQQFELHYKPTLLHLQSTIETLTNPTSPFSISSANQTIDCKVLGEDAELIVNTACNHIFNYTFSMRVLSIIAGFTMLGLMLVATFFGVRAWNSVGKGQAQDKYVVEYGQDKYGAGPQENSARPNIYGSGQY